MKISNTKLILFHPSSLHNKHQTSIIPRNLCLLLFLTFFTLIFTLTRLTATTPGPGPAAAASSTPLPDSVYAALLHYASISSDPNTTRQNGTMTHSELSAVASVLLPNRPDPGLNLLVFGIAHETALFHALNFRGRTVVLDENEYAAAWLEQHFNGIEAYEVQYTTRVSQARELIEEARETAGSDCRPVQNLLYSDCRLVLNAMPNHIYDVDWDVILIDAPRGDSPDAPGRMSAIFTAGVLARSKKSGGKTDVFVHDFDREVEAVSSSEFLCEENLVQIVEGLAHFVMEKPKKPGFEFCKNPKSPLPTFSYSNALLPDDAFDDRDD